MRENTMIKVVSLIKTAIFIILLLCIIHVTQTIFTTKFKYPNDIEDHLGHYTEYDRLEKNTIDVLTVGTSHAMHGVSPMEMYEAEGVVGYNLASSAQSIELSYLLLKKAFKTQKPKVVLLDASSLFLQDFDNAPWRKVVDSIPFSKDKVAMAKVYATEYTGLSVSEQTSIHDKVECLTKKFRAMSSLLFPLYYYHGRWTGLTEYDWSDVNKISFSKGYYMTTQVIPASYSIDQMNKIADDAYTPQTVAEQVFAAGELDKNEQLVQAYKVEIPDANIVWLQMINALCKNNNTRLVLFKVPSINNPLMYEPSWTALRSRAVCSLADSLEIDFLDLQYDIDLGIDLHESFSDGGGHLNFKGAEKVSAYLGAYLKKEYQIEEKTEAYYETGLKYYERIKEVAALQTTSEFDQYCAKLNEFKENSTILIASNADISWLSDEQWQQLRKLGVTLEDIDSGSAYICVIDHGRIAFEMSSDQEIKDREVVIQNGNTFMLSSVGVNTTASIGYAGIIVNENEYAENTYGLNIVILDDSGQVIDSVGFYPNSDGSVGCQRTHSFQLFKQYEHAQFEFEAQGL